MSLPVRGKRSGLRVIAAVRPRRAEPTLPTETPRSRKTSPDRSHATVSVPGQTFSTTFRSPRVSVVTAGSFLRTPGCGVRFSLSHRQEAGALLFLLTVLGWRWSSRNTGPDSDDDAAEGSTPGGAAAARIGSGRAGLRRDGLAGMPRSTFEPRHARDAGDRPVVFVRPGRMSGAGSSPGVPDLADAGNGGPRDD
jgi:hypothetical protein